MRKLTAVLAVILLLLLGFTAWFWVGGTLHAKIHIQTARAADYPEAFASIRGLLESGSVPQLLGSEGLSEDPAPYTLADISVTLTNRGLFPAQWLDIRAEGAEGDIAVYAVTGEGSDVAPRDSRQIDLKLITTARPDAGRDITIQYYVYGLKREITVR